AYRGHEMTEVQPTTPGQLASATASHEPANLADVLERVLDKGLVIAGDIQVNLLDIELLTIKLRLVIASLETAKQVGIDWWEHDPWLSATAFDRAGEGRHLAEENRQLRERVRALESRQEGREI